jgi:dipeptidyl aminopeptidase/acylaminoacyl peptidase
MGLRVLIPAFAAGLTASISAQTPPQSRQAPPPPPTEVYLAALSASAGRLAIEAPVNVSNSPGYDNQPSFTPDGAAILFTSRRQGEQTDIYRYEIASRQTSRVTETAESEYSPTVTPDGTGISVIRVEADSTQRLWRFTRDGREPRLVLTDVKPVGYHAWIDGSRLALFVLGRPSTLQIADTRTGKAEVAASSIGRSLHRIPGSRAVSYVQREADAPDSPAWIVRLDADSKEKTRLVRPVQGSREHDYAWTPDGRLLMALGSKIYAWTMGGEWQETADLSAAGIADVSRIAVSPKGDRIAFVAAGK